VQKAIDICTHDGGGTVLVPAGTFVIGTVELKSNVTLHIAATGKLLGSGDGRQYHSVDAIPLQGDATMDDGNWALLFALESQNITIEGQGTIDGQGAQFRITANGTTSPSGLHGAQRPYHFLAYRCQHVRICNVSLIDCAYHSIRMIQSRLIYLDGLYIHSRVNVNNDGFHLISTEFATISNCTVLCGDDACAMFGSCRNITVTNSYFSTRWSVFRFGGGHAKNIAVSNCILAEVYGCPIKFQCDNGSSFTNMSFSNLVLQDVTGPICISAGSNLSTADYNMPAIVSNISFSHIHGTVTTDPPKTLPDSTLPINVRPGEKLAAIVLNAVMDAVLRDISFDNVHLTFGAGGTSADAQRDVPQVSGEYFALGPIPAYGLYARNCRGLTLQNLRFEVAAPELRPAVFLDNVEDAAMNGFSLQCNPSAECAMRFRNVRHTMLNALRVLHSASTFLLVEGNISENIRLDGGDLSRAAKAVAILAGVSEAAVRIRTD
jgi:hypothetical protein